MTSTFIAKMQVEQSAVAIRRSRNPQRPEELLRWLRRHAMPVVGKLVEMAADLKNAYGQDARLDLHIMTSRPGVEQWGGYRPTGPYLDLSVSLDGGRTGTGSSLFLEVADNVLFSQRPDMRFDADDPNGAESIAFLEKLESVVAHMLRNEKPPAKPKGFRQ